MPDLLDIISSLPPAARTLTGDEAVVAIANQVASRNRVNIQLTHRRGGVAVNKATGKTAYHIIGSYRQDDAGAWVECSGGVVPAELGDNCVVKSSTSEYKSGLGAGEWPVAWKRREDNKLYRARPVAVSAFDELTAAGIDVGIVEQAKPYAFDAATGVLSAFAEVELRLSAGKGGVDCRNTLRKELREKHPAKYYGVVWEMDDGGLVGMLMPDGGAQILWPKGTMRFVEYVEASAFDERDKDHPEKLTGKLVDVVHNYTTIAGDLAAPLALAADTTYYLTALINLGTNNVTSTATDGHRSTIKTNGTGGFRLNSTGTFVVSYVDFTSPNDNSLGETIAGSSGTPAAADQTVGYVLMTMNNGTEVATMTNWTARYCTVTNESVIGWKAHGLTTGGRAMTLINGVLQYTTISAACGVHSSFVGSSNVFNHCALSITNLSIDQTNTCDSAALGVGIYCSYIYVTGIQLNRVSLTPTGSMQMGFWLESNNKTLNHTVSNCLLDGDFVSGGIVPRNNGTGDVTTTISNCTARNTGTGGASHGLFFMRVGAGTCNGTTINNIIKDCAGNAASMGLARYAGTEVVTHTYNRYFNNTTDCFEALDATEGTGVDPQLGNLPAGCVIDTDNCPFSDGYAVGNLALEFTGSDTFDNLGIDESTSTMTGWRYAGTKLVTPGVYYILTTFPEAITGLTPATGPTVGGTAVSWAGVGFGATQGTGKVYLDGVEQTVTAWAETGPDITTLAHAAGAVAASCTNYRGATFSLAAAFTFVVSAFALAAANDALVITPGPASWRKAAQYDDTLAGVASLVTAADQLPYSTGLDTFAMTALTAYARTILDDADAATVLATIGAATAAHLHDTQTLQNDGINSDGGAFAFSTTGAVTFNQAVRALYLGVGRAPTFDIDLYKTVGNCGILQETTSSYYTCFAQQQAKIAITELFTNGDDPLAYTGNFGVAAANFVGFRCTGSGGMGIGTTDAATLTLGTADTARVTIEAAGNVMIGSNAAVANSLLHLCANDTGSASHADALLTLERDAGAVISLLHTGDGVSHASGLHVLEDTTGYNGTLLFDGTICGWKAMVFTKEVFRANSADGGSTVQFVVNEGGLDCDVTVKWDSGTSIFSQGSDGFVGIGHAVPDRLLHAAVETATTNAEVIPLRLTATCSDTADTGFAVGLEFEVEDTYGDLYAWSVLRTDYTGAAGGDGTADIGVDLRCIEGGTATTYIGLRPGAATINDHVHFYKPVVLGTIKSGATQVAAGAAAGEIWKTASHATLPDNVLLIGV